MGGWRGVPPPSLVPPLDTAGPVVRGQAWNLVSMASPGNHGANADDAANAAEAHIANDEAHIVANTEDATGAVLIAVAEFAEDLVDTIVEEQRLE